MISLDPLSTRLSHAQFDQPPKQALSYFGTPHIGTTHIGTPHIGTPHRGSARSTACWMRIEPAVGKRALTAAPKSQSLEAPSQALTALLNRFDPDGMIVPPETLGIYTDFSIAEYQLRLYALIWAISTAAEPTDPAELSLFLILGPIKGSYLPIGTRLTVKENHLLTTEPNLQWTAHPAYLYTQVFGLWEEQLTVEVLLPNTRPFTLSPLNFQKEHLLN
jgi:hypothetical protein